MKLLPALASLTILGALFTLTSCKKKEEAAEASPSEDSTHPVTNLIHRKVELEEQLESIISKADVSGHQEIKQAEAKAREADLAYIQVQRQHPKLKKYYDKINQWAHLKGSSNPNQRAKAMSMTMEMNTKIAEVSATLPELAAAEQAKSEARLKIHTTKREVAQKLPEAVAILDELTEVDARLLEERPE